MKRIGLVSLGCSKNLVNSEEMLFLLDKAGYLLTDEIENADAVLVNTCGFIDSAKAEAIENILELGQLKKEGKIKAIIVTGCLAERHREELFAELPEIDVITGCGSYHEITEAVSSALAGEKRAFFGDINAPLTERSRISTMPPHTVYIKIAEGCDNCCAYCVIPSLRGKFRSRKIEDILAECRSCAENGARELIIIAQDITRYGLDLYGEHTLPRLISEMVKIPGVEWIRLHYLYPGESGVSERKKIFPSISGLSAKLRPNHTPANRSYSSQSTVIF